MKPILKIKGATPKWVKPNTLNLTNPPVKKQTKAGCSSCNRGK